MHSPYTKNSMHVKMLQDALNRRFGERLKVDGHWGNLTMAAVVRAKKSLGLKARPYVGPLTWKAIVQTEQKSSAATAAPKAVAPIPPGMQLPWMAELVKVAGYDEHELRTKQWLKSDGDLDFNVETTPWCGEGVATALNLGLGKATADVPDNHWGSINWLKWGIEVKPQYGCVMVFWRGKPTGWKGHVGFCYGEDETHYHVLGCNQKDAINVSRIAKGRLREHGARWPTHFARRVPYMPQRDPKHAGVTSNEA